MATRTRTTAAVAAALLVLAGALTACAAPPRDPRHLVVWTLENLEDRLAVQRASAQKFTDATGITVDTVGVDEDQFNQLITASAASGELPDVVGALPLAAVRSLAANELLDPAAAGRAVADLGPDTFAPR